MKLTQGQPLIQVNVPYIFQAQYDEPGREAVKKILSDYKNTNIRSFNQFLEKGPIKGSNPYFRFALGNAYRELTNQDVLPINPKESEIALANNTLTNPGETYEELGLLVYSNKGYNLVLWQHLREIAKTQYKDSVDLEIPFVVTGLMKPVKDDKFEDGLRLDTIDGLTLMYNVPILAQRTNRFDSVNKFDSEDPELQRTGFPGKLGEGNRILFTQNNGVHRLIRGGEGLYLYARYGNLVTMHDDCRIHLVAKNSSRNLDELVQQLEQEKLKQQQELETRYNQALEILKKR
ncbi:hypothetical protein J4214_03835 [Candidatus Woesearchaeota archaeon]|nr:hypothetical protein [Candidatus Woesearchaeota archaeon]